MPSGNSSTWQGWVTVSSASTTATDSTWGVWASDDGNASTSATTTTATNGQYVWMQWSAISGNSSIEIASAPEVSEERRQERQEKANARKEKRDAAIARSLVLLEMFLNPIQIEQLKEDEAFTFQKGEKTYRIEKGFQGNIYEVDSDGKKTKSHCAHPNSYDLPVYDHMLAQKLAIETNEEAFLEVANSRRLN